MQIKVKQKSELHILPDYTSYNGWSIGMFGYSALRWLREDFSTGFPLLGNHISHSPDMLINIALIIPTISWHVLRSTSCINVINPNIFHVSRESVPHLGSKIYVKNRMYIFVSNWGGRNLENYNSSSYR